MNHHARAQTRCIDVGDSAVSPLPKVGVHVLVIRLEDPNRQMMIKERRFVIQAAAKCQSRTPRRWVVIGAFDPRTLDQPVQERCDVAIRKTKYDAGTNRVESVVVPVRSGITSGTTLLAPVMFAVFDLGSQVPIEVISTAEQPTHVHRVI